MGRVRRRRRARADAAEARERKRERLVCAAVRVVRRDGPAVSMDEIAREAGVTKPIVYRVFGDREGLISAVAERFADDLASTLDSAISEAVDDRARVRRAVDAYLSFIEKDPAIVRFLLSQTAGSLPSVAVAGFVQRVGQLITQSLGEALRARGLDSGAAEPWAYAVVGAVHLAGDWWLERRTLSRERLVDYLTALFWDGMANFETVARTTDDRAALYPVEGRR